MKKAWKRTLLALLILGLLSGGALGGWLWYDSNVDRSGWLETDKGTFYLDFHGKKLLGFQEIDGKRYHFEEKGMSTGWLPQGGDLYYLDETGVLLTDWQEIGGYRYFLGADGVMQTGWLVQENGRYYLDSNGRMRTGWLRLQENRYYFGPDGLMASHWQEVEGKLRYFDESGRLHTGWLDTDQGRYFLNEEGSPLTGWTQIQEEEYLFAEDGRLVTGWAEKDGKICFLAEEGGLATGWQEIEGKQYYFDEQGFLYSGWLQDGEYRRYLKEDGTMAVGPTEIDGQTLYFTPKGIEVILVNGKHAAPEGYQVELSSLPNNQAVAKSCAGALEEMLAACRADGCKPQVTSGYRSYQTQKELFDGRLQSRIEAGEDQDQAYWAVRLSVALPGYSEHHLGLALDISGYGGSSTQAVYDWLAEHCWEYGFILRYPDGKSEITGIIYEPWHVRYVGKEVSMDMKDTGLTLEEYLGAVE